VDAGRDQALQGRSQEGLVLGARGTSPHLGTEKDERAAEAREQRLGT